MTNSTGTSWRKSRRSNNQGECVEVSDSTPQIMIRDSKLGTASPTLAVSREGWKAFIAAVQ